MQVMFQSTGFNPIILLMSLPMQLPTIHYLFLPVSAYAPLLKGSIIVKAPSICDFHTGRMSETSCLYQDEYKICQIARSFVFVESIMSIPHLLLLMLWS